MLLKIALVLALLIALVLVYAALQPSTFQVVRSAVIAAPPGALFGHINDLHRWQAWSPYEKLDPAMKREFSGPAAGVGATYAWSGNRNVGSGRMTIVAERPAEEIRFKLEFLAPMAGVCEAVFTFAPEGGGTRVTWRMSGRNNYAAKVFCLFMNMDRMIGGQFAAGLASLKQLAENPPAR